MINEPKVNLSVLLLHCVACALIFLIMPFQEKNISIVFICMLLFFSFIMSIKKEKKDSVSPLLIPSSKDFQISYIINLLILAILGIVISLFSDIIEKHNILLLGFMYTIMYFLLIQNISFPSPGFYILKLYYNNDSIYVNMKIFLINILTWLWIWLFFLKIKYNRLEIKIDSIDNLIEICFLVSALNTIIRYFTTKKTSFFEKVLRVQINKIPELTK